MTTVALLVFSLALRLVVAHQSFWLDEAASIDLASLPISKLFLSLQNDFHPPLYYLLLRFWLLTLQSFGLARPGQELLIRLPGIIIGAATVPLLFVFLKRFLPKSGGLPLLAAILLALNPLHVYYSIELRMYALNCFLSLLSWHFLLGKKQNYFVVTSLANLFTFYGAFFNLFAQWLYVLFLERKQIKSFVISNLVLIVFFLPLLPLLTKQLSGGGYLQEALPAWGNLSGPLSLRSLGLIMAKFTLGRISLTNKTIYAIFVVSATLYFLFISILVWSKKTGRLFHFWFYGSLLGAICVSLVTPVLGYWRFVSLLPPFISLIVLGLSSLPKSLFHFNLLVVVLIFISGLIVYWTTPSFQREDWQTAAKLISTPNSLAIINFTAPFAPLKFYAPAVFYYPSQESLGKIRTDLDQTLPTIIASKKTIYVFDYLSDLTDKKRSTLAWLKQAGLNQVKIHDVHGVGFIYEFVSPTVR